MLPPPHLTPPRVATQGTAVVVKARLSDVVSPVRVFPEGISRGIEGRQTLTRSMVLPSAFITNTSFVANRRYVRSSESSQLSHRALAV